MTVLNIRNMPDDIMRKAKSEAALQGVTLKEFVIAAMEAALQKKEESPKRGTASRKQ